MSVLSDLSAIQLGERIIELLDRGRTTTTYKYAVLLGLMDACVEKVSNSGRAPDMITTYELATKVLELYWPHTSPYERAHSGVLLQGGGRRQSQAEIVRDIVQFRQLSRIDPSAPLARARRAEPARFERLLRSVEWKLIEMPLPRLQTLGDTDDTFLYQIYWDTLIKKSDLKNYPFNPQGFDNRIMLRPGVGNNLVRLNNLLRPFIHRDWARKIAVLNRLDEENELENFLFGVERISTEPIRLPLQELQNQRCFYCERALGKSESMTPQVDHFVPWARYPNNSVENLVIAHARCNGKKSDFLAAEEHVARWSGRMGDRNLCSQLREIAAKHDWDSGVDRTLGIAHALYLSLPAGAKLWDHDSCFVSFNRPSMLEALRLKK